MAGRVRTAQRSAGPQEKNHLNFSAWIEVNLDALEHNLQQIQAHSLAPILPILKGNAYGHGARVIAAFFKAKGFSLLGVSSMDEALAILQSTKVNLLVLAPPLPSQVPLMFGRGIIFTVTTALQIQTLGEIARKRRQKVTVHIKVDTGFGRLGTAPESFMELVQLIKKNPYLNLGGVFTHFAAANTDHKFTCSQLNTLLKLKETFTVLEEEQKVTWHGANSAALVTLPASHLDLVRVGTLIYGQSPVPLDSSWRMQKTWQFKTRIIQIRTLPKGHGVGYGHTYRTKKPTLTAVIPVGYSHGLEVEPQSTPWRQMKQALSKTLKAHDLVFHESQPLPILGRIGMGLTCIDLSNAPQLKVGDAVEIAMRRVTSNPYIPRIYYYGGTIQCIEWNQQIHDASLEIISSKSLF